MKYAIQTDGEKKQSVIGKILRVISVVIFVGVLGAGCIYLMKKRDVQIDEEEPVKVLSEEEQSLEFEKYLKENEDALQKFTEWSAESILGKREYIIIFDRGWYRSCLQSYEQRGLTTILYSDGKFEAEGHEEIERTLNEDTDLMEVLNLIKEDGTINAVRQENLDEPKQVIAFSMDIKLAPSIIINFDYGTAALYWSVEVCEEYGYENIEGNWYRFIGLSQEQLERVREKKYVEFEKMFWGNKKEMQSFVDALHEEDIEGRELYIVFDEDRYQEEFTRNRASNRFSVLLEEDSFEIGEDEELERLFNENAALKDITKTIKEKGMITNISVFYEEDTIQIVEFYVDTKYTLFIKIDDGVPDCFVWCEDKDYDRYWCKKVEDNWYMDIKPGLE